MTDQAPDANTRLAAERTRLAQERTLMAWVRTCTSLIAFGFTIYQIFRYLSTSERLRAPFVSPQVFGVVMIVIGLTALVLAWLQHRQGMNTAS
jgi:putative membrane protein